MVDFQFLHFQTGAQGTAISEVERVCDTTLGGHL